MKKHFKPLITTIIPLYTILVSSFKGAIKFVSICIRHEPHKKQRLDDITKRHVLQ
jgi:hypothetical protein